ncbi:MAG: bifunctional hydroxymethylpyrimidine kinase/phosphomethylpyrimidine kinase [Acidobacteriota bacterium]
MIKENGQRMSVVLTIAGFDPSAGAGVLADIKTIAAFHCYGAAVVTSVTHQNTIGVFGADHLSASSVTSQLRALFDDFQIAAVKTGMLPTSEIISAVAAMLSEKPVPRFVLDPVIRSTSGYDLIDKKARRALVGQLFPLASLVTPNRIEAETVTGIRIDSAETTVKAARALRDLGARAVLIKGGDAQGEAAVDVLVDASGENFYSAERIHSRHTHGTGCALSAALACLLALDYPLKEAVPIAKRYIAEAIRSAPGLGHGHGPMNHFPTDFRIE